MPEVIHATPSMSVAWATPLASDGPCGGTITKPAGAGRSENSPRTNAAAISWYIVNGWALSVTAFSPGLAAAVMSILPNALSSHHESLAAVIGVPLQVIAYRSGRSMTIHSGWGTGPSIVKR